MLSTAFQKRRGNALIPQNILTIIELAVSVLVLFSFTIWKCTAENTLEVSEGYMHTIRINAMCPKTDLSEISCKAVMHKA